jgi:hypothetical protein
MIFLSEGLLCLLERVESKLLLLRWFGSVLVEGITLFFVGEFFILSMRSSSSMDFDILSANSSIGDLTLWKRLETEKVGEGHGCENRAMRWQRGLAWRGVVELDLWLDG